MNTETGEIADAAEITERLRDMPPELRKKEERKWVQIPPEYFEKVKGMNRAERRRFCKKMKWPMWANPGDRQLSQGQ